MGCHPPSCTYLVLAAGGQQLSLPQPGDDGLGVPECHAGQGDAAAFLRLHVLRRRLREGGGSWGAEGDPVTPSWSHTLSPSQWHGDRVEVATHKVGTPPESPPPKKRGSEMQTGLRLRGQQHHRGCPHRALQPRGKGQSQKPLEGTLGCQPLLHPPPQWLPVWLSPPLPITH